VTSRVGINLRTAPGTAVDTRVARLPRSTVLQPMGETAVQGITWHRVCVAGTVVAR
jgi:hypothetical protein